jgi:hypothetical protein
VHLAELCFFQRVSNQLSGEEDIATGCLPHSVQRGALDDAVQRTLGYLVELGSRQCL